jgi:protein phosphatase
VTVLRSGSATDVGRVRKVNQDLPLETDTLYAVADGMGGHVGGEVAARVAIEALLQGFTRAPTTAGLHDAFNRANRAVWQESQDNSDLRGMGTTLTAVALVGGENGQDTLALANVGDSRAYLYSEGQIVQVTADHSLAEERMRHGELTEAEAAVHPQRHILTRALGIASDVEADMWELHLRSGDRVVLCSDGLSNELDPEELAHVLERVSDPGEAAHQLVDVANGHGGSDNITVVVVDVLVGEEESSAVSVVKPLGVRAGAPLVITHGAPEAPAFTGETQAVPRVDGLAPGSQLGFGGARSVAGETGPRSDEFFRNDTMAVPVARSSVRAAAPVRPNVPAAPPNESRGARRRRLGIPRRITFRVIFFVILIAAIPTGAYYAIRWYAYDNWYLSVQGKNVVIHQGHAGGVLWFHPKLVAHGSLPTNEVLPVDLPKVRAGVQEASLASAQKYEKNLKNAYLFLKQAAKKEKSAIPKTTVPDSTVPGATTTPTTAPVTTTPTTAATTDTVSPQDVTTTTGATTTTTEQGIL